MDHIKNYFNFITMSLMLSIGAAFVVQMRCQSITQDKNTALKDPNKVFMDLIEEKDIKQLEALLAHGIDINGTEPGNLPLWSAVQDAVYEGDTSVIKFLLARGSNVNAIDLEGDTVLNKFLDWLESRYANCSLNDPNYLKKQKATVVKLLKLLLAAGADSNALNSKGARPLHAAIELKSPEIIKLFIDHKADVNLPTRQGYTPFNYLLAKVIELERSGLREMYGLCKDTLIEIAQLLLNAGANLHLTYDKDHNNPIRMAAIIINDPDWLRLILSAGADISQRNWKGQNVLQEAADSLVGNAQEKIKLLLNHGGFALLDGATVDALIRAKNPYLIFEVIKSEDFVKKLNKVSAQELYAQLTKFKNYFTSKEDQRQLKDVLRFLSNKFNLQTRAPALSEAFSGLSEKKFPYAVSVVGFVNFADGIGRQTIGLIDVLKDKGLKINWVSTSLASNFADIPADIVTILKSNNNNEPGTVAILEDVLTQGTREAYRAVPAKSFIKLAYSMLESTAIPAEWVAILNKNFDAVVVPDPFLVDVYKKSGVKIPIFMVPLGVYLEDFLKEPPKKAAHKPFIFGSAASGSPRKNTLLLVEAFSQAFGDNPDVRLRLNMRSGDEKFLEQLRALISHLGLKTIELNIKPLSNEEYLDFLKGVDAYVSVSKGEGFSIQPRESIALGIPTLVTDNTAQSTIARSGYAKSIPSPIKEPAMYGGLFGSKPIGYFFNTTPELVADALKDVYNNYNLYLDKAHQGREWVKQYLYSNLQDKYLNLVNPKQVILGAENSVTDEYLQTKSSKLYKKYLALKKS